MWCPTKFVFCPTKMVPSSDIQCVSFQEEKIFCSPAWRRHLLDSISKSFCVKKGLLPIVSPFVSLWLSGQNMGHYNYEPAQSLFRKHRYSELQTCNQMLVYVVAYIHLWLKFFKAGLIFVFHWLSLSETKGNKNQTAMKSIKPKINLNQNMYNKLVDSFSWQFQFSVSDQSI